jgi:hypothetical protein
MEELVVWTIWYEEGVVWRSQDVAPKSWGSVKHFDKLSGQNDQSFDLPPSSEGLSSSNFGRVYFWLSGEQNYVQLLLKTVPCLSHQAGQLIRTRSSEVHILGL